MLDFVKATTVDTARSLLGQLLVYQSPQGLVSGYIVETEAYVGAEDEAAHSFQYKRTPKLESMYAIGGTIYIYTMHTHKMLNIVTKEVDEPQAVLIRALEPLENAELMIRNRHKGGIELTNGPGKLTKALGISTKLDGKRLGEELKILPESQRQPSAIKQSARIGIPNKGKWTIEPLRFYVAGHPYVSQMKKSEMLDLNQVWQ
ncbi:DNA-3-methyladenine glycosylase [Vagococcus sp. BWB3-3]|uniref:Putative 3-methyladenine DNA glycosylase n=1 Tax=Vagococcus allomyrinae TaxID=2794353 RepID=A0A940SWI4_9ENTE|nr:DNA-3-methyladenine glycosylase [Vagococcus allomyrinae]MBP1043320.1 DNA-3-methyladenine glycosylase [Vagococcus allomyrinae]